MGLVIRTISGRIANEMLTIRDISVPARHDPNSLIVLAANALRIPASEIARLEIRRRSLDARKKEDIRWLYTVDVATRHSENQVLRKCRNPRVSQSKPFYYRIPKPKTLPEKRPVVIGFGPGGMFAALALAMAGCKPIVIERGQDAETRRAAVERFWQTGVLDPESNVQFGEGGAGTFSDGKLNTGTKNERQGWILRQFAEAGADESVTYDAKPHVGTDVLIRVVQNIRAKILALGGEVHFGTKLTGLQQTDGRLTGIEVTTKDGSSILECEQAIMALGHSARDTFELLERSGIPMEPKPFSMGVRVEHLQRAVNEAQYGPGWERLDLPPADYKLSVHLPDGGSAYTFCMCPGGSVVAAASEAGRVVTNGMSNFDRGGENANAALLVTLNPEDFPDHSTLGGMRWQREIEETAFRAGGSNYRAPAQRVGDFLAKRPSTALGAVKPTYQPGVTLCDLHAVLPEQITGVLEQAIPALAKKLRGYDDPDAVMTAPETRSSSPVRILRGEDRQSPALRGLYPCGEGAGYAGGILSAAVDGLMCAEAVISDL